MNQKNHTPFLDQIRHQLNLAQMDAVTYTGGPMLVLAGAGSGKTRVITYRMAYLISDLGLAPWNILAVTFTNKAAGEMKERVAKLLHADTKGMWIGTFHSLCSRILRTEGKKVGLDSNFTVYDRSDQLAALKQAMSLCDISKMEIKAASVLGIISKAKSDFQWPDQYETNNRDYKGRLVARIYKQYQKILRSNNALDFDDLLIETVRLLIDHPEIADVYRKRFHHILVDEYQDTNHPQYLFLRELSKSHRNICAVGDDDQSIYSWRGATIRNILEFEKDYPKVKIVRLEQNYRSTKTILAAASHLVQFNQGRHPKTLWCDGLEGEKLGLARFPDGHSEAYWVCSEVQRLHNETQVDYKDCAIFYRTNAQSRPFEEECIKRGIPYTVVGGTAFYERKEIKDMLAYARLLVNPNDLVSFQRIVNEPKRKLGTQSVQKLYLYGAGRGISIMEAARTILETGSASGLSGAAQKGFAHFASMFTHWRKLAMDSNLAKLLDMIYTDSGYRAMLEESKDPQDQARIENVTELITAAAEFEENLNEESNAPFNSLVSLQAFLENIALISDIDQMQESEDRIVFMTIHGAKGLEFPYVFMTGMEDGLFPHNNSLNSNEQIEEERRLCYVGITRAKVKVYLTFAEQRRLYNEYERTIPSRFLEELPADCIERIAWGSSPSQYDDNFTVEDEYADEEYLKRIRPRQDNDSFIPGDMVSHRNFGFGVVLQVEGTGGKARITVDFQTFGKKILVQEYAKMQKV